MIELRGEGVSASVVDELGARLGSIRVGETELLVTGDGVDDPIQWGGYVMAPWVGRIRDATFTFGDESVHLEPRLGEHAAHGLVDQIPWTRTDDGADPAHATCVVELPSPWNFGGTVTHEITLGPDRLTATLTLRAGDRSMPAELGWHPWFRTTGPITFTPSAMYERDGMIPTGRLLPPAAPPWDDCFIASGPVSFPIDDLTVSVDHDHDHVVVFDHLRDHGIAVEPQTGPPDAVHVRPRVVEAGGSLRHTMTIAWQRSLPTGG